MKIKAKLNEKILMTFLSNFDSIKYDLYIDCLLKYKTAFQACIKHEGKRSALTKYKSAYQFLSKYMLNLVPDSLPFCKTDRNGLPKYLWPLRPLIDGSISDRRAALAIARMYELIRLPIEPEFDKITDEGVILDYRYLVDFEEYCYKWFSKQRITKRLSPHVSKMIHTRKQGPNGPAIMMSHYDIWALDEDPGLLKAIYQLNHMCGNNWINELLDANRGPKPNGVKVHHSKLSFSAEPGGKTRTFAIGDYWSQMSLKGIHKMLLKILRTLKTDATYDQDGGFARILAESRGKETFCFDLSGASDRIPLKLQTIMLSTLFYYTNTSYNHKSIAAQWERVIGNRKFQSTFGEFSWTVGQPLGLLSSWGSFALWHHIIIEYLAFKEGIKSFREYQVLGDDVVIWNKRVALAYVDHLRFLGIPINLSKSVIGTKDFSQIEFAKRIAICGKEITGIKYTLTNSNKLRNIPQLIDQLIIRNLLPTASSIRPLTINESHRRLEILNFLLWLRLPVSPSYKRGLLTSVADPLYFEKEFAFLLKDERYQRMQEKISRLVITMNESPLPSYFKSRGVHVDEHTLGLGAGQASSNLTHPLVRVQDELGADLEIKLNRLYSDEFEQSFDPVEYLPEATHKSFFGNSKELSSEYLCSMSLDLYFEHKSAQSNGGIDNSVVSNLLEVLKMSPVE